jgi:hypothetical protein
MDIQDAGPQLRAEFEPDQPTDDQFQKHSQLQAYIQKAETAKANAKAKLKAENYWMAYLEIVVEHHELLTTSNGQPLLVNASLRCTRCGNTFSIQNIFKRKTHYVNNNCNPTKEVRAAEVRAIFSAVN